MNRLLLLIFIICTKPLLSQIRISEGCIKVFEKESIDEKIIFSISDLHNFYDCPPTDTGFIVNMIDTCGNSYIGRITNNFEDEEPMQDFFFVSGDTLVYFESDMPNRLSKSIICSIYIKEKLYLYFIYHLGEMFYINKVNYTKKGAKLEIIDKVETINWNFIKLEIF